MTEEQKDHYLSRVTTKSPFTPAPKTRKEMLKDSFVHEYVMAEKEEVANLASLGTFEIARRSGLPNQAKTLKCKWVYADKLDRDGSIVKLKARLTAMGCFQREGIDYHETFASVARTKTLRVLMSIYNSNASYTCEHWDVKNAFVNAPIEEAIWIEQPDGHELANFPKDKFVLRLRKALYGTKQAARAWQQHLKQLLHACGAVPLTYDDAVYKVTTPNGGWVLVGTHVDDLFVLCNPAGEATRKMIYDKLSEDMVITNDGEIRWALKARIDRDAEGGILKISQEVYIRTIIERFGSHGITECESPAYAEGPNSKIEDSECASTPTEVAALHAKYPFYEAIGCLWWAANISQPVIFPAVQRCAQYIACPSEKLWIQILRIFGYLKKFPAEGLIFQRHELSDSNFSETTFVKGQPNKSTTKVPLTSAEVDSSLMDARKGMSTLGQCSFFLGNLIDWKSSCSTRVAESSAEAETMAVVLWARENAWLRNLLVDIWDIEIPIPTPLLNSNKDFTILVGEDNAAAIAMSEGKQSSKTKYFSRDWYKVVDRIKNGEFKLIKVPTEDNRADFFTKALKTPRFQYLKEKLMGPTSLQSHFSNPAKEANFTFVCEPKSGAEFGGCVFMTTGSHPTDTSYMQPCNPRPSHPP